MTAINKITRDAAHLFADSGEMDVYQSIAQRSAVYPGQGSHFGLIYCALKLNGEAGELAEHVGKAMRDDAMISVGTDPASGEVLACQGGLTPERKEKLIHEVGDQLWYLSAICRELGITLEHAAYKNLLKLADRTERDALRGSGDDR